MDHVYYSKNGENWVDLSNVPLKVWRERKIYDWCSCDEWLEVPFKYDGILDILLLKFSHTKGYRYVTINYGCCTLNVIARDLQRVHLGGLVKLIPIYKPYMIKYFKDGFYSARQYRCSSRQKIELRCCNCGYLKISTPMHVLHQGFACDRCSTNISFPERFTISLFEELGWGYERQKKFSDTNWRYDFYIPHLKLVVEVHGGQHFHNAWTTKDNVVKNDSLKRKFVKFDLGLNYAAIDMSVSEPYYVWSMLEQNEYLKQYVRNVDYENVIDRCNRLMFDDSYLEMIRDYKKGVKMNKLVEMYKIPKTTLVRKLRKANVY